MKARKPTPPERRAFSAPKAPSPTEETLLTEVEAARVLRLSVRTLQKWRLTGDGPRFIQMSPRAVRYRPSDLKLWIEARVRRSTSQAEGG